MGLAEPCDWQSDTHCTYPWDYNSASSSMEDTGAHTSALRVAECLPRVAGGYLPGAALQEVAYENIAIDSLLAAQQHSAFPKEMWTSRIPM